MKKIRFDRFGQIAVCTTLLALPSLLPVAVCGEETGSLAKQLSKEFSELAAAVGPAVVNIATVRIIQSGPGGMPGHPLEELFGPRFNFPRGELRQQGLGSGVVASEDGYVLTNNHVVADASELKVRLTDGRELFAELVGGDPETDIAVLRLKGNSFATAKLGDSDKMEVGNLVLAIGSPFGLDRTVTAGIISAIGRANVGITEYEDFLQTDAAINPGNSGGPIVNMDGEVVGISTAIFSRSGGSMGVGFAIPINVAKGVMDSLIKEGRVRRGWLGVSIQDITPDLADALKAGTDKGALVAGVIENTPAEKAGFKNGDIITEINEQAVEDATALRNMIAALRPNDEVSFKTIRDGKEQTIKVIIGERPSAARPQPASVQSQLGFEVRELSDELRERFEVQGDQGVLVVGVNQGSNAYTAGIRPGAIILEVNRKPVASIQEFNALVNQVPADKNILFLVKYQGTTSYILVRPSSQP